MAAPRLQSFGLVRGIEAETRRVTTVVSTGDIARDGMVIEQAGWLFDNYDRNPVVLWAHRDSELPIARTVDRSLTSHELTQTHEFATHPAAEEVFQAIRGGFVNATSVRWLPKASEMRRINGRDVLVFTQQELLETSYVPIPADPGAIVMRADGRSFDPARMTIDYSSECSVRGCPEYGFEATVDLCEFHFDFIQTGELPMPPAAADVPRTHSHHVSPAPAGPTFAQRFLAGFIPGGLK